MARPLHCNGGEKPSIVRALSDHTLDVLASARETAEAAFETLLAANRTAEMALVAIQVAESHDRSGGDRAYTPRQVDGRTARALAIRRTQALLEQEAKKSGLTAPNRQAA